MNLNSFINYAAGGVVLGAASLYWFGPVRVVLSTRRLVRENADGEALASARTLVVHVITGPKYGEFEAFLREGVDKGIFDTACETCFATNEEIVRHKH